MRPLNRERTASCGVCERMRRTARALVTTCAFALFTIAANTNAASTQVTKPLVIAHRACTIDPSGSHYPCEENTLAAIRHAASIGADMVELDVRTTADGTLVLLHDKRLARTTNGRGKVYELSLSALRKLDAGAGQPVPTLDEALDLTARLSLPVLLDLKSRRVESTALVAALAGRDRVSPIYVGAHSPERIRELRRLAPHINIIAFPMLHNRIGAYLNEKPNGVRLWARWANDARVDRLRAAGLSVWVTAGTRGRATAARLRRLAIDGIITDRTQLLLR